MGVRRRVIGVTEISLAIGVTISNVDVWRIMTLCYVVLQHSMVIMVQ